MEGKERMKKLDETDQLILSVAKKLFLEQGIRQTEMKDIAARVSIGRSTLYRRFSSKELISFYIALDILHTLNGAVPSEAWEPSDKFSDAGSSPAPAGSVGATGQNGYERFAAYARSYAQTLSDHIPEIRFLDEFDQIFTDSYPEDEMSSFFRHSCEIEGSYGERCLEEGVHDGSVRLNSSPQYMMNLFTQSVMGAAERILPREAHYIEEHGYGREFLFSLVELFLAAIRAR